jgi:endonuclease YncB( thermonuclease family)
MKKRGPYFGRSKPSGVSLRYISLALLLILSGLTYLNTEYQILSDILGIKPNKAEHSAEPSSILSGIITHVRDGDTFEVNGVPVRLAALDCPEKKIQESDLVTAYAKQFKGQKAICELTGAKSYDRVVGYCSVNGQDFIKHMIENTSCKLWPKYDVWKRY